MKTELKPDKELESLFRAYHINWKEYYFKYCSLKNVKKKVESSLKELRDIYGNNIIFVGNKASKRFVECRIGKAEFFDQNAMEQFECIWESIKDKVIVLVTSYDEKEKWEFYLRKKDKAHYLSIYSILEQAHIGVNWDFYLLCTTVIEELPYLSLKERLEKVLYKLGYYAQYNRLLRQILIKFKNGHYYCGRAGELTYGRVYSPIGMIRFFLEKDNYENYTNKRDKEISLEKTIIYLLIMRDFKTAFQYMDEYICKGFRYCNLYEELKTKIIDLLDRIMVYQSENEQKNIIINWVDNISRETVEDLSYIYEEEGKKGVFFENAFTSMPWTGWVMKSIFSRKNPISGKLFRTGKITNSKEFPLLGLLKQEGYSFKYSSLKIVGSKYIAKKHLLKTEYFDDSRISTRSQWYAIDCIVRSTKKMCVLIHNLQESHYPFVCPRNSDFSVFSGDRYASNEQKMESKKYLNEQLKWFGRYYGDNCIKIYMGDHGDRCIYEGGELITRYDYTEERTHVFATLIGENIEPKVEEKFFSFSNFYELLFYALYPTEENYSKIFLKHIDYEMYDKYKLDAEMRKYMQNLSTKVSVEAWMQCRGIRTDTDKYIRFFDGTEYYFILPDETKNEVGNPKYQVRIKVLRKYILEKGYLDIQKYEFFNDVKILYKAYEASRGISLKEMGKI